jgi:hypothetical protein
MGHSTPPLRIGFQNGQGYAVPDMFERERREIVEVRVETACSVRFDRKSQYFFSNQDYSGPQNHTWVPIHVDRDGTPEFKLIEYQPQPYLTITHSIKIGSGRQAQKEKKAKAKNKTKQAKSKKGIKKTRKSRKRSS